MKMKVEPAVETSAEFTYRLDRMMNGASTFRVPPAKIYYPLVFGLSDYLNNPSVIFLVTLHSLITLFSN